MLSKAQLEERDDAGLVDMLKALRGNLEVKGHAEQVVLLESILEARGSVVPEAKAPDALREKQGGNLSVKKIRKYGENAKVIDDLLVSRRYLQTFESAVSRGLDFNLTITDMRNIMRRKRCAYTGMEFDQSNPDRRMTLERIDNTIGYVKGNVIPVCHIANLIKNKLIEDTTSSMFIGKDVFRKFVKSAGRYYL